MLMFFVMYFVEILISEYFLNC